MFLQLIYFSMFRNNLTINGFLSFVPNASFLNQNRSIGHNAEKQGESHTELNVYLASGRKIQVALNSQ